jgi:transcriptional regulator with XRE-family HTH domain
MAGAIVMTTNRMWASPDMRVALARHDVGTVFRLMQRYGFSQRAIAARTGITQAEVSEIVCGRRRVLASPTVCSFRAAGLASRSTTRANCSAKALLKDP